VIQVVDVYHMYYWGTGSDGYHHICLAETSIDSPNAWKACGSVLDRQPGTEYNDQGNGFPFVVPQKDGPWLMYICGWGTLAPTGNCRTRRVLRSVTTQDRASTIAMKRRF
jgi:hypothetical protein